MLIDRRGFQVFGTRFGGWVVMCDAVGDGSDYGRSWKFTAAFTTFEEMLEWLGKQPREEREEPHA